MKKIVRLAAFTLPLLLLIQLIPILVANATRPERVLVSNESLDTEFARNLIQSLNCNNGNEVGVVVRSPEYYIEEQKILNTPQLQEKLKELYDFIFLYGYTDILKFMLDMNMGNTTLFWEFMDIYSEYNDLLLVITGTRLDPYILFNDTLLIDKQMQIIHPNFNNFVQNDLYAANSLLILANADIFAEMVADAVNMAFIEKGRSDLALVETMITDDMRFSIYMPNELSIVFITCRNGIINSVGHGFLHMFCEFDKPSFPDPPDPPDEPTEPPEHTGCCIDYSHDDILVPGSADGFEINLTKETITIPATYTSVAYSVDGGTKWKNVKPDTFSDAKFPKLFNKDLTLHLSDKPIDKKTKKPPDDAAVVTFAAIGKRAAAPKLTINYLIGADNTGATPGQWVLTEKGGSTAVKENVQIGAADAAKKNKVTDEKHFGCFYDGLTNGICVKELKTAKPIKSIYLIRTAPQDGPDYKAASKVKKVKALSEIKAPRYKVKTTKASKSKEATKTIKYKANTIVSRTDLTTLHPSNGLLDVMDVTESIWLWTGATAKKPASVKLEIRF